MSGAGHRDRPGVRGVGQESAEGDDELAAEVVAGGQQPRAELPAPHVRLDPADQDHVAVEALGSEATRVNLAHPDVDGRLSLPPNKIGRSQALETCFEASPDRVHVFDVENHEGTPVYVHAKACVIDDVWACVGSDNLNRRSWTHDSELSCAVLDSEGSFARDLRLRLLREHLDRAEDGSEDRGLADPVSAVEEIVSAAEALGDWYTSGRKGPRPPGRLRPHKAEKLSLFTRLWAEPVYRLTYDPDGRSYRDRLRGRL